MYHGWKETSHVKPRNYQTVNLINFLTKYHLLNKPILCPSKACEGSHTDLLLQTLCLHVQCSTFPGLKIKNRTKENISWVFLANDFKTRCKSFFSFKALDKLVYWKNGVIAGWLNPINSIKYAAIVIIHLNTIRVDRTMRVFVGGNKASENIVKKLVEKELKSLKIGLIQQRSSEFSRFMEKVWI